MTVEDPTVLNLRVSRIDNEGERVEGVKTWFETDK